MKRQLLVIASLQESLDSALEQAKRISGVVDELEAELGQLKKEVRGQRGSERSLWPQRKSWRRVMPGPS